MSTPIGALTRAIAIDALTHVLTRRIHSDVALEKLFQTHKDLRPLDRAFIYEMTLGTLRWMSKMDWIISHMMDRPFSTLDPRVANAIRVGAYQIYYMDRVPERAAVSETVEAMRIVGAKNAVSFVNAILRRVARKAEYFPKPNKDTLLLEYFAMHYAHPLWMIERYAQHMPQERLEFLLQGNNRIAPINIRILSKNPLPENEDVGVYLLRTQSIHSSHRPLSGTLRLNSLPQLDKCEAFQSGAYIIQDESPQLATSLISFDANTTVLDACAAPGGKSICLVDRGLPQENLTICDFSQKRLKTLESNLQKVHITPKAILHGDAVEVAKNQEFDVVLLDAPCSSTGVIRKHPEIKWLRTAGDIQRSSKEQERMLDGLSHCVKVGGELVYMVCSVEPEETFNRIDEFLASHPNFVKISSFDRIHDYYKKYILKSDLYILPGNIDELDGFYATILKRVK